MTESPLTRLRDQSSVVIRAIAPEDRERLRAGFEQLSDRSRYLRFQAPIASLTEQQLSYLTVVDHHDHEALVALDPDSGDAVGVARFVRVQDDLAECAVVVADDWQGRGLGTELLDRLVERAREEGVQRFTAVVLAENTETLRMLERLGEVVERSLGSQIELEIALPERPVATRQLHSLLAGAARGALVPAMSMWRMVADFVYRRRAPVVSTPANTIVAHAFGSDQDAPALTTACELAALRSARVHLVDCYWPVVSDRDEAERRLSAAADELRGRGVAVTVHLIGGDAVDAVIDVAQQCAASLIVIDPRAPTGVMPWRSHAMSDRVCARAPCDVLIVR